MKKSDDVFKKKVTRIFHDLKNERRDPSTHPIIPVYEKDKFIAYLRVVSMSSLDNPEEIKNLADWRKKHSFWFPTQFQVTKEGTKKWLKNQVLKIDDRLLFIVETPSGIPIGHMGLYRFNFSDFSCEIDNVVRGKDLLQGAMTLSLKILIDWTFSVLGVKILYLRCFLDNNRAISLYKRCGFKEVKKIPLKKNIEDNMIRWEEKPHEEKKPDRYNLQMMLKNPQGS